jgi:hypothetical protein
MEQRVREKMATGRSRESSRERSRERRR